MMFQTIMDLFMAGTETTSTSLLWTFYFLVKHPDVQEKCRQELLEVSVKYRQELLKVSVKCRQELLEVSIKWR